MKKLSVFIIITLFLLSGICAVNVFATDDYLKAPGGTVASPEEFAAALGGDDAAVSKGSTITMLSDVSLTAPIYISEGEYILNGAGCHIDRGFDGRAMFIIEEGASLTLGNERGSDEHPSQTFNGGGHNGSFVFISGGELTIHVGTLISGFESDSGAIFVDGGKLTASGGAVTECTSTADGGAVCMASGTTELKGTSLTNNKASGMGGVIYCADGTLSIDSCTVAYNSASSGGAIALEGGEAAVTGLAFEYNTSTEKGGTLYIGENAAMYLVDIYAVYSEAKIGGAAYNMGTLVLGSGQITMNKADIAGGVYNTGELQMLEMTVNDNEAAVMCGGVYNSGNFIMNGGGVSSNKTYGRCGGLFNTGTFYMNEGGISSNKFKDESHKYGLAIENWGTMTLSEHAFISFNNDVLVGAYPNPDGSVYRAEVIIESILTANTPIATFTPVYSETGYEAGDFVLDFEEGRAILTGEADILAAAKEKLAMSNDTKRTWTLNESGQMLKDGYVNGNPYIVAVILIAAAAVCGIAAAVAVNIMKKKKSLNNQGQKQ